MNSEGDDDGRAAVLPDNRRRPVDERARESYGA